MSNDEFIKKWFEGELSKEELSKEGTAHFEDQNEFNEIEKVVEESAGLEVPKGKTKEQAWNELLVKLEEVSEPETTETKVIQLPVYKRPSVIISSIAASLTLLMLAYFTWFANQEVKLIADFGEQKTVILPDNSKVVLNAGSNLTYNKDNWLENRVVQLEGMAYFEVVSGEKFEVSCSLGSIDVLGTSFNVISREDKFEVACYSGKVNVSDSKKNSQYTLTQGLITVWKNGTLQEPVKFEADKLQDWIDGDFYYSGEPLTEVFAELERQFNVTVDHSDVDNRDYNGYFNNKNLEDALKYICDPMGLKYEIREGGNIRIHKK
ncbi:FecR domain-containing protein [Fulvivirgaceae bacterium BMA10]|uniref:FecR domain-containing protein n=1 Tax=Splendidivirga corallicola TaxID=3051826 RepID=A0ABT8KSP3_9BACT|nr:FecR domain-containing protein [Fulvivirgaceae bacterium BMA10]